MVFKLVMEMANETRYRHGGGIAERANGAAFNFPGHVDDQIQIFQASLAVFDAMYHARQPAGAFTTWRALAARFFKIEMRNPR